MEKEAAKREIKHLLKNYRKMDQRTRSGLTELGFVITSNGKHYKITNPAKTGMVAILGKTASDYRAGRNTASYLCYML